MKINCVFCSSNPKTCPIHGIKFFLGNKEIKEIKEFSSVSPPTVFIGSKLKYPSVNIGVMSPPERVEDPWILDMPSYWAQNNFSINQIINLRRNLINSRKKANARELNDKFVNSLQEIGMAVKPVDVEIELNKGIKMSLNLDEINSPRGPSGEVKKLKINDNIKVHNKVEKVIEDSELKAVDALNYLYDSGFNEQQLSQLLSIGILGLKDNRRLVPTRLSITATDDIIGKKLIKEIIDFKELDSFSLFFGGYLGNFYLIMMIPNNFSYEIFETYLHNANNSKIISTTDYESYFGRTNYASQTAGGYYTVRLAILEKLKMLKRKASIIALRFITPSYYMPLGVFVTREATRKALKNEPRNFNSFEEMLNYTNILIKSKFQFDINQIIKKSKLIKEIKTQKRLSNYF